MKNSSNCVFLYVIIWTVVLRSIYRNFYVSWARMKGVKHNQNHINHRENLHISFAFKVLQHEQLFVSQTVFFWFQSYIWKSKFSVSLKELVVSFSMIYFRLAEWVSFGPTWYAYFHQYSDGLYFYNSIRAIQLFFFIWFLTEEKFHITKFSYNTIPFKINLKTFQNILTSIRVYNRRPVICINYNRICINVFCPIDQNA